MDVVFKKLTTIITTASLCLATTTARAEDKTADKELIGQAIGLVAVLVDGFFKRKASKTTPTQADQTSQPSNADALKIQTVQNLYNDAYRYNGFRVNEPEHLAQQYASQNFLNSLYILENYISDEPDGCTEAYIDLSLTIKGSDHPEWHELTNISYSINQYGQVAVTTDWYTHLGPETDVQYFDLVWEDGSYKIDDINDFRYNVATYC